MERIAGVDLTREETRDRTYLNFAGRANAQRFSERASMRQRFAIYAADTTACPGD